MKWRTVMAFLGLGAPEERAVPDDRTNGRAAALRRQVDRARDGDDLLVIVVFAPSGDAADAVRRAAAQAGAGAIGDYRACSFSAPGEGRFEPQQGAHPAIGSIGVPEVVEEHRIEVVCPRRLALTALDAMLAAHPYEEPAYHVYATISRDELRLRG